MHNNHLFFKQHASTRCVVVRFEMRERDDDQQYSCRFINCAFSAMWWLMQVPVTVLYSFRRSDVSSRFTYDRLVVAVSSQKGSTGNSEAGACSSIMPS